MRFLDGFNNWLDQELKESQSPSVCPFGPGLSRASNLYLSCSWVSLT